MANRVLWLPTGPRSKSSSRIQVYNIHDKLSSLGYNSVLLYEPKRTIWRLPLNKKIIEDIGLGSDDLVIIQKFKTGSTLKYIQEFRKTGCKIGFIDCDEPIAPKITKAVDFVIVPSVFLKQRYEEHVVNCYCIQDCPEIYVSPEGRSHENRESLCCVWFGNHSKSKWKEVAFFKNLLKSKGILGWNFETISNTRKATHRWGKDSFTKLTTYDLVVIPVPEMNLDYSGKSANRLLQSMALGLPVLASPIPSYLDITKSNNLENLICTSADDWEQMLDYYSDVDNRMSSIHKNYEIAESYSLDVIIKEWINTFNLTKGDMDNVPSSKLLEKIRLKSLFRGYEIKFA